MGTYERPGYSHSRLRRLYCSCSGQTLPFKNLPHFVPALWTALSRRFRGRHAPVPFIPFEATSRLDTLLQPSQEVVEIGAGMSTLWISDRVAKLHSFEWDRRWFDRIAADLGTKGRDNVSLTFCREFDDLRLTEFGLGTLDGIFVDGGPRSRCLVTLWPMVKAGGWIYLDNWDSDLFWLEGGIDGRSFLEERHAEIARSELVVDYVPGYLTVNEGLILVKR